MDLFIASAALTTLALNVKGSIAKEKGSRGKVKSSNQKKGSFLLVGDDPNSDKTKIISEFLRNLHSSNRNGSINATVSQEVLGRQLIASRDKQLGPNISVFYKQDGGLVITSGKGMSHVIIFFQLEER